MEKRKVYKISIIDKEISRTEFDRNTFYTSDSELTLVFKLIERDYSYEHGEILLYNENDKSFVTRKITKQENDFVYEIDSDIIQHYGKWKAQLQLVNDGDVYTSKPFEFSIVNDLSNLAPQPTLTDINNWATLKQSAAELIDEMQTVIDDIKKAEYEHENAERIRQNQENSRVQSESVRNSQENVRSKSENTRQNQENKRVQSENERRLNELEREKAENNRQSIFENNEVRRKDTFNNNEEKRQENETARQQAESERRSAELIRSENEKQRVLTYENMQETIDMIGKVKLTNLIDYSKITSYEYELNINGTEIIAKIKQLSTIGNINFSTPDKIAPPNKYYTRLDVEVLHKNYSSIVMGGYMSTAVTNNLVAGQEVAISTISQPTSPLSVGIFRFTHQTNIGGYEIGDEIRLKNVVVVDLTKSFGMGNEPTKEVMDWIITQNGYFDELTLKRDDIQQYEINQLRKAVIALGGTI